MWEYRTPGAPCFSAPVKPRARYLLNMMCTADSTEILTMTNNSK